jgi:methionyl aminopeptidase
VLREGDLITIDFGAIVDGWHGDAAITVPVGSVSADAAALSAACRKALWDGLVAARAGGRLTDISYAVETSVRASGRYGIVTGYGGHGIGTQMHMDPHVQNVGRPGRGPHLVPGMALAIEPMITLGAGATHELADHWTVTTADGSLAAHWEHTVAILDDGPWVLTALDGGRAELAARGVSLSAAA